MADIKYQPFVIKKVKNVEKKEELPKKRPEVFEIKKDVYEKFVLEVIIAIYKAMMEKCHYCTH